MLFLSAQTNTCKGHVICYSIWYETMHHQLPKTWSKYLHNVLPCSLAYLNNVKSRVQSAAEQNPLHAGAQYDNFATTIA